MPADLSISPSKPELVLALSPPLHIVLPGLALLPAQLRGQWAPLAENQPFQTRFVSADPRGLHKQG